MIITLCGSARFEPWFHAWNEFLGLMGHCVFGLSSYPSAHGGKKHRYSDAEKQTLDEVHRDKINASDAVLVLNVFAYIGESTLAEIKFAKTCCITTAYLESWGKGCGIGPNHRKEIRRACARFSDIGKASSASPIETSECIARPSAWHLLRDQPAGEYRSKCVTRLHERIRQAIGTDWG